jgi:hypothetical protein
MPTAQIVSMDCAILAKFNNIKLLHIKHHDMPIFFSSFTKLAAFILGTAA